MYGAAEGDYGYTEGDYGTGTSPPPPFPTGGPGGPTDGVACSLGGDSCADYEEVVDSCTTFTCDLVLRRCEGGPKAAGTPCGSDNNDLRVFSECNEAPGAYLPLPLLFWVQFWVPLLYNVTLPSILYFSLHSSYAGL